MLIDKDITLKELIDIKNMCLNTDTCFECKFNIKEPDCFLSHINYAIDSNKYSCKYRKETGLAPCYWALPYHNINEEE